MIMLQAEREDEWRGRGRGLNSRVEKQRFDPHYCHQCHYQCHHQFHHHCHHQCQSLSSLPISPPPGKRWQNWRRNWSLLLLICFSRLAPVDRFFLLVGFFVVGKFVSWFVVWLQLVDFPCWLVCCLSIWLVNWLLVSLLVGLLFGSSWLISLVGWLVC